MAVQRISIREINCTIHWTEIYLGDSVIHLSNNRALGVVCSQTTAHCLLLVAAIFDFETRGDLGVLKVLSGSRGWV